jgi:hypothetical protein
MIKIASAVVVAASAILLPGLASAGQCQNVAVTLQNDPSGDMFSGAEVYFGGSQDNVNDQPGSAWAPGFTSAWMGINAFVTIATANVVVPPFAGFGEGTVTLSASLEDGRGNTLCKTNSDQLAHEGASWPAGSQNDDFGVFLQCDSPVASADGWYVVHIDLGAAAASYGAPDVNASASLQVSSIDLKLCN